MSPAEAAERARTGQRGERAAAKYYIRKGYRLLDHNYHTRFGELDLVLCAPDGVIVICEVKTRSAGAWARPAAAVDHAKQRKICLAAARYLQVHQLSERFVRFDVAEAEPIDETHMKVSVLENAFDACLG